MRSLTSGEACSAVRRLESTRPMSGRRSVMPSTSQCASPPTLDSCELAAIVSNRSVLPDRGAATMKIGAFKGFADLARGVLELGRRQRAREVVALGRVAAQRLFMQSLCGRKAEAGMRDPKENSAGLDLTTEQQRLLETHRLPEVRG